MTRRLAFMLAACGVALATASVVVAAGGKYQIKLNAADQGAARAVVIRRADLDSSGWQGGSVKPDLADISAGLSCPSYHPKLSDLVITGAAETDFRRSGFVYGSVAEILKTRRMVALDWRRSVLASGAAPCLRRTMSEGLGSSAKLVSFRKLPFPHVATYTALFRSVISVQSQGQTTRVLTDLVFLGRSRTEITLSIAGRARAKSVISAAERRLARTLISRARA
jgi:hypothetical protein